MDRRRFLTLLGVSGAGSAALSGCSTERIEKLVPYLVQAEDFVPGVSTVYASTCTECSAGCGLHVETREARAIKLEGNPEHPVNRGRLCARGQAALQGLYNPGRIRSPMARNAEGRFEEITWDDAIGRLAQGLRGAAGQVAVLSGAGEGTFTDLLRDWTAALGGRLVRWEPLDQEPLRLAHQRVFGRDEVPAYDFARARYILSFGTDFLETWLAPVEQQRGFAESHGFTRGREPATLVYLGPRRSLTGLNADEWHAPVPGSEAGIALAMANVILSERTGAPADANALRGLLAPHTPEQAAQSSGLPAETIRRLAREFASARPGLAVTGDIPVRHAAAVDLAVAVALLNYVAGNVGETVRFGARLGGADGYGALRQLQTAMEQDQIGLLLVHEANPLHTLPPRSGFAAALARVPLKVSAATFHDETSAACDLLLPNHHALERWDDLRPRAGIHSLMQPVMHPVFRTLGTGDVLLRAARMVGGPLAGFTAPSWEEHLKTAWTGMTSGGGTADGEAFWREALRRGGLFSEVAPESVRLAADVTSSATAPVFEGDGEFLLLPYPSPMLFDGRGANRPWLLENPDPVTKITWQTWVEIHPETAHALDLRNGEHLRVTSPHGEIEAPVYVYPGVRPDVVALPLGLGHTDFGEFASGRGVNVLALLGSAGGDGFLPYVSTRVRIAKTGRYTRLAHTDGNPRQLGRGVAQAMPLSLAQQGLTLEEAAAAEGHPHHEINPERELEAIAGWREAQVEARRHGDYAREHPKWGMVVDLSRCTGCSACVTACYAENNIPWVGEQEVLRGREMSWLRIERYWEDEPGDGHAPASGGVEARFLPMLCQHCENAPCEPVCPVYAAYHTPDGLNGQVYNRCVGTRYCGNNCPYKVRYFNWFAYAKRAFPEPLSLQLNPDVTVRARGVMEKCTFCIQRIRQAQHEARLEDRELGDGDVITACAQACPSGALVFGDLTDPASAVAALAADPRGYHVLEETNARPAITYLAKVLHPTEA